MKDGYPPSLSGFICGPLSYAFHPLLPRNALFWTPRTSSTIIPVLAPYRSARFVSRSGSAVVVVFRFSSPLSVPSHPNNITRMLWSRHFGKATSLCPFLFPWCFLFRSGDLDGFWCARSDLVHLVLREGRLHGRTASARDRSDRARGYWRWGDRTLGHLAVSIDDE